MEAEKRILLFWNIYLDYVRSNNLWIEESFSFINYCIKLKTITKLLEQLVTGFQKNFQNIINRKIFLLF